MKRSAKRWIFPVVVLTGIGVHSLFDSAIAINILESAGEILLSLVPVFAFILAIMVLTSRYIDTNRIASSLGRTSKMKGASIAALGGILSTGAIYMWYPLLGELVDKGASQANIAIFLYNRAVKLPLIPIMIAYFGIAFTLTLLIVLVLTSFIQGSIMSIIMRGEEV